MRGRSARCPTWTRAADAPPPAQPRAPAPEAAAYKPPTSLQWRRPADAAAGPPAAPGLARAAPPPPPPAPPAAPPPERAYRRTGRTNNSLVRACAAGPGAAAASARAAPARAAPYVKPTAHSLLRRPAGAGPAAAPAPRAPRGVARGRVRKAPRVRLLSADERGLIVRQLRGEQNCALLYRRTGFALRREGVRGGAGGANMTWTSRTQPRLRAAAAGAAARAAASAAPQPPQPRPRAMPRKRAAAPVQPPGPVASAPRAKSADAAAAGAAPRRAALHLRALCLPFCRTGRCRKPEGACPLRHDVDKVAVCHRWLKGACADADCPLTHKVIPARMPVCHLFLEGRCSAAACPYLHVQVSPSTPVCTAFVAGFCPRGLACTLRHSLVCPALLRDGACPNRERCRFHHPLLRKRAREGAAAAADADADEPQQDARPRRSLLVPSFVRLHSQQTDAP